MTEKTAAPFADSKGTAPVGPPTDGAPTVGALDYARSQPAARVNNLAVCGCVCSALALAVALGWTREAFRPVILWVWLALTSGGLFFAAFGLIRSARPAGVGRRAAGGALALALLALAAPVLGALVFPPRSCCQTKCVSNLKQIGLACLMYVNEPGHGGRYPATAAEILENEEITSDVFICPSTTDTRAAGPTTQAVAANLTAGGHLSYIYVGNGLTGTSSSDTVVAYEPLSNHGGQGMHVLWADGHVDWEPATNATKIAAEVQAGHNPPRPENLK